MYALFILYYYYFIIMSSDDPYVHLAASTDDDDLPSSLKDEDELLEMKMMQTKLDVTHSGFTFANVSSNILKLSSHNVATAAVLGVSSVTLSQGKEASVKGSVKGGVVLCLLYVKYYNFMLCYIISYR